MKLTNEICISFLRGSGWLYNHDKEITISEHNKAIDDFAGRLIRYVDCGHLCSPTEMRWSDLSVVEMVKKLADQLKAGGAE